MAFLLGGKRLPTSLYAIKVNRKGDNEKYSAADVYTTKGDMDSRLKRIRKFSYEDEKVELVKGTITWEPIETQHGEIERR